MAAAQPPAAGGSRPPPKRRRYVAAGAGLFALLVLQQSSGWRSPWLDGLQGDDLYKQVTGFVLLGFVGHQWYFPLLRIGGDALRAARASGPHKAFGAVAPLLFVVHTQQLGHAYTTALALGFLALFLSGLINPETARLRHAAARTLWTLVHVGLATAVPLVIGLHVYVSYVFE